MSADIKTNSEETSKTRSAYEVILRAIGQALEARAIESFELVLEGDNFVVYGGSGATGQPEPEAPPRRFQLFRRKTAKVKRRNGFQISGMRFWESDVQRLDRQGMDIRTTSEKCPDASSVSHNMRMIGAHLDKTGLILLRVTMGNGVFTVWHKSRSGAELKEVFTQSNLYDLWVHLYKKRTEAEPKRTGTTGL
jgi:hypothetical protein